MWTFQYKHGDRPLEGYTIERTAGRGGFGEVYYAISDSGREVALKAVQGYEQIELRGISQCMNLKSPHLVSIFDVKHNDQGRPFVIMEFVNGPSLRQLLDESPSGLGEQKSAFFLREIAKGLTFLHDCGIVHRDLKPGNIFYENGYVKIGDYGLSKAISIGQTSQQTVTVGTVHYMAPEIGVGKYDRSIDIYAMGAVLFELLTGTVPFVGASPSEILMKHLSAEPDCKGISEPFATVIKKAMHKDPTRRYQSIQEMVEAVFGAEHVRNSMSMFAPDDLSMVAGRVAIPGAKPQSSSVIGAAPTPGGTMWTRMQDRARTSASENPGDAHFESDPEYAPLNSSIDPMPTRDRILLAIFTSLVVAVAAGVMFSTTGHRLSVLPSLAVWLSTVGASIGFIASRRWIALRMSEESSTVKRAVSASCAIVLALAVSSIAWTSMEDSFVRTIITFCIALCISDSSRWVKPWRAERIGFRFAVNAGFLTWVIALVASANWVLPIAVVAGTALMVQVLSPWDPRGNDRRRARLERFQQNRRPTQPPPAPAGVATPIDLNLGGRRAQAFPVSVPGRDTDALRASNSSRGRPASRGMRITWIIAFGVFFTIGMMLLIGIATNAFDNGTDIAVARGFGVALIVAACLSLLRSFFTRFVSAWQYFFRPILLGLCLESILISSTIMAGMHGMQADERMIGLFFIIFPLIAFMTIVLISWQFAGTRNERVAPVRPADDASPHNRAIAAVLCGLFGCLGLHRFYVGKIGTGILWLCTGGLFFFGALVDLIVILSGGFRDVQGRLVKHWDSNPMDEATPFPEPPSVPVAPTPPMPAADRDRRGMFGFSSADFHAGVNRAVDHLKLTASQTKHAASRYRRRRALRPETGGLLSVLSAFLIYASVSICLALTLDAPGFFAAGLPAPSVAKKLETEIFRNENWPVLMRSFGSAAVALLMFIGLCGLIFAPASRFRYVLRGIIGALGMLVAMIPLSRLVPNTIMWQDNAPLFQTGKIADGVQQVLTYFHGPPLYFAGGIFLLSAIIMAIPARKQQRVRTVISRIPAVPIPPEKPGSSSIIVSVPSDEAKGS